MSISGIKRLESFKDSGPHTDVSDVTVFSKTPDEARNSKRNGVFEKQAHNCSNKTKTQSFCLLRLKELLAERKFKCTNEDQIQNNLKTI